MAIEPELLTYATPIAFDGTLEGFVAAATEFLATNDPEAVDAWFTWNGQVVTIDAAAARGEKMQ